MNDGQIMKLEVNDFASPATYAEVYDIPDEITRQEILTKMRIRAKEVKATSAFDGFVRVFDRVAKTTKREEEERAKSNANEVTIEHYTNFQSEDYGRLACGMWVATEDGIYYDSDRGMRVYACAHPILPAERLKNIETGEEYIVIAFKRRGRWEQIKVKKTVIASANKIVQLADYGINVTSESAKALVRYLSDVEMQNDDYIKVSRSTSKLGWHGDDFLPYDSDIVFDSTSRFKSLFDAVNERGSYKVWLDHVKEIRKRGRFEALVMMAASFASPLIQLTGQLPFFLDLYGETEGGKTVTLMLATSIWADPKDSKYIGDFKTTDTALEARADMLNNIPVILDDTSKVSQRIMTNFEAVVYDLCSGKGKSRSNKELGINRENHWHCCFLTNGERPLSSYVVQGGAMNRILEVECLADVYEDPSATADILKDNFGFAGKIFVEAVRERKDEVIEIYQGFRKKLERANVMQKQVASLAVILTADKLAEEIIFKDGVTISVEEAQKILTDHSELSDNMRCYEYLCDKVAMNKNRFDKDSNIEQWGVMRDEYAGFFSQALTDLCKAGGFSKKTFVNWAVREGIVKKDPEGKTSISTKVNGRSTRCTYVLIERDSVDEEGFATVSDTDNLPFI